MPEVSLLAVVSAAAAGFVASGVYYSVVNIGVESDGAVAPPWLYGIEFLRSLVVSFVVVVIVTLSGINSWYGGAILGLVLWIGLPMVLWVGAVIHEGVRVGVALAHAGDWLAKRVVMGALAGGMA
jgi:hypothetical protein